DWLLSLTQIGHARLLVDEQVVVDATGDVGRSKAFFGFGSDETKGSVTLEAGQQYGLVVEYEPRAGFALSGLMIGAVPPVLSDEDLLVAAETAAAAADAAVCVVGTTAEWETEGHDRSTMDLPGLQGELVRRVVRANPRTCVLVNAGAPVTMDWAGEAPAVAQIWFPGEQGGEAAADVLLGEADPGGRLPTTIPHRLEDTPAFAHYPGDGGHVAYGEGLLIGYRHYDAGDVQPLWPFGHGLSYTTFALADLDVRLVGTFGGDALPPGLLGDGLVEVAVTATNTGERAGTEVVQCYLGRQDRSSNEPVRQLRGVAKVSLAAGESERLTIVLNERSFARWDGVAHAFVATAGDYEIWVGRSSRDLPLAAAVTLG
ncbi:MAG TPA: glycoside hydrolase family 3 C-terminal domain-containing protein, partial [Acidimicrobiales bacterium]|nr:glycoside hydrolase family 3 C-terminal domain-containing protein [Acidimicrobiales bacterium]